MSQEEFYRIYRDEEAKGTNDLCIDAELNGLNMIRQYVDPQIPIMNGATHDKIFACYVEELAGISEEEVRQLRRWGWMLEGDYLTHFI